MEFKELIGLIETAGYEPRSYSGRGMGGKACLGIDCFPARGIELTLIQAYLENCPTDSSSIQAAMDLCEQLKDAKTDSMGRGEIVYWPNIAWEETEDDSDELSDDALNDLDE